MFVTNSRTKCNIAFCNDRFAQVYYHVENAH